MHAYKNLWGLLKSAPALAALAIGGMGAAGVLVWLFTVQLAAEPIADDFSWLHYSRTLGPFGFFTWFLTGLTGRYSNAAVMAITLGIFGDRAIVVVPIVLTITWVVGLTVLTASLLRLLTPLDRAHRTAIAIPLGMLTAAAIVLATPSIFDTFVWYNSVCIFLASLSAATWLAVAWIGTTRRSGLPAVAGLVVAVLLAQGFSETTAVVVIVAALFAVGISAARPVWRPLLRIHLPVLVAGVVGLAIVFLLPGTAARGAIQAELFPENTIGKILGGTLHTALIVTDIATSWRVVAVVALGLAIWLAFRGILRRHPVWFLVAGVVFAFAPVMGTGFVTYVTVQAEPYRTQTVSVAIAVISLAIGGAALLALVERVAPRVRWRPVYAIAAAVAAVFAVLVAGPAMSSISQAVEVRQSMADYRDQSVRAQLEAGTDTVTVNPAPILLASSDSVDFSFNDVDVDWFATGFAAYYGFDAADLRRDRSQPAGYCLASDFSAFPNGASVAQYFGALPCGELARR